MQMCEKFQGKKVKVTWKKVADATGYEIYRSTKKAGKYVKIKSITKRTTTNYLNKKLKKKKTYYYKVRSYKMVGGKKYYSAWSSIRKVKVKK